MKTMPKTKPKPASVGGMDLHYSVNVSVDDKALIDRAAATDDEPKASRWIRKIALREARRVLGVDKVAR